MIFQLLSHSGSAHASGERQLDLLLCSAPTEMHDIPAHRGSIQKVRIPFVFASSSQALYCLLSAIVASHPVDKILKVTPLREFWLSVKSGVPFV